MQSFLMVVVYLERIVIILETDLAICRFGRGNHAAYDCTSTDVDDFLDKCDDLSVHIAWKSELDYEDSHWPT